MSWGKTPNAFKLKIGSMLMAIKTSRKKWNKEGKKLNISEAKLSKVEF